MKMREWIIATLIAGGWMLSPPARATTLVSMSLDQLTQASSKIVQGRVVSQVSAWNAAHTQILTVTTLQVSEVFKGSSSSTVEVEQWGGTVGNFKMYVPGEATFLPAADYVVFLEPIPDSPHFRLVGMTEGAYRVYQDAGTHQDRVILPNAISPDALRTIGNINPSGTLPLDGFHKYVATLVQAGIQIPHGLALRVSITSTESAGVGRLQVYGKTTTDMFPSRNLVIPAGTEVAGTATLSSGKWTIRWDELNLRGVHAQISAENQESEGSLRGRNLVLNVR